MKVTTKVYRNLTTRHISLASGGVLRLILRSPDGTHVLHIRPCSARDVVLFVYTNNDESPVNDCILQREIYHID